MLIKNFFLLATLFLLNWAQAADDVMPKLYNYSGSRPTEEMVETVRNLMKYRSFDPLTWPEIVISKVKEAGYVIGKRHTIYEIQFPVWNQFENKFTPFTFKFYAPVTKEKKDTRLVVICPTIEGETLLERSLARQAISAGQSAIIAPVFAFDYVKGARGLDDIKEKTIFGVNAINTFFDFINYMYHNKQAFAEGFEPLTRIQPKNIIQIGLSNGTVATQMVSRDHRVSNQVLIIPIGNVPGVFATTTNDKLTAFREEQMAFYGLTSKVEFAKLVRQKLVIDPLDSTADTSHVKTLVFSQSEDLTVPSVFQTELTERLRATKFIRGLVEFRADLNMFEMLHSQGFDPNRDKMQKFVSESLTDESELIKAFDVSMVGTEHFHEVGWGHVQKILSIVFLFNRHIKEVLFEKTPSPTETENEAQEYLRELKLKNNTSCRARLT